MAKYIEIKEGSWLWSNPLFRTDRFPLDRSSMFSSKADAIKYANSINSPEPLDERGLGLNAYIGQIITVYENSKVDVYKIEEDLSLSQVGGTETLSVSYSELTTLAGTAKLGQMFYATDSTGVNKNGFYIWTGSDFKFLDVSEGTIAGDKVASLESSITGIQSEITGIKTDISNRYTKTETDNAISTALTGNYVTTGEFSTYQTNISSELSNKANTSDLSTKADASTVVTLSSKVDGMYTNSQIDNLLSGKSDTGHNHDNVYVKTADYQTDKLALDATIKSIPTAYEITGADYVYTLYETKDGQKKSVGEINIPKDTVVKSGYVKDLAEGEVEGKAAGTYIVLELANSNDVLYVPADKLVDVYTSGDTNVYIADHKISLDIAKVAENVSKDSVFASTFVKSADNNTRLTTLESDLKTYAENEADSAETAAKGYTDTKLADYQTTADFNSTIANYATTQSVNDLVNPISTTVTGLSTNVTTIQTVINDPNSGNATLKTAIDNVASDVTIVKTVLGSEANGENPSSGVFAKLDNINTTITTLDSSVVKSIKINNTEISPENNIITIVPVDNLDSATDGDLVSAGAIKAAITTLTGAINAKSSIIVVDELPAVSDAVDGILYVGKNSDGDYSEVIKINGEYKTFGEDRYVGKNDLATVDTYNPDGSPQFSGRAGLISSADLTKLRGIEALTEQDVLTLLQ